MKVLQESYQLTDEETMGGTSFLKWLERERVALNSLMMQILQDEEFDPVSPPPVSPLENMGNLVDTFTFLDVPVRRTMKYQSGNRPENAGVGRHIVELEVFCGL